MLAVGLFVASRWRSPDVSAQSPSPPAVSAQQKAVEQHLRERYAAAMQGPSSIATVGPLCLAYHADMFFDAAERCYDVAATLAPGEWRWTYYRAVIQSERGGGDALVANLRQVVERAPQFGPAWLRLGEAEFKAGRYDRRGERHGGRREICRSRASRRSHLVTSRRFRCPRTRRSASRESHSFGASSIRRTDARAGAELRLREFGSALRLLAESYRKLGRETEAARFVYRAGRVPPVCPLCRPSDRRAGA